MPDASDYHPPRPEAYRCGSKRQFRGVVDAYEQGYKDGHLDGSYSRMLQDREPHYTSEEGKEIK